MALDFSPVLIFLFVCVTFVAMNPEASTSLRFEREPINQGEYWRLITANFMHTNWPHFFMNVSGLTLVLWIFRGMISLACLHFLCWGAVFLNTLLLFLLSPDDYIYLGFSGALYGIVLALCLVTFKKQPLLSGIILCGLLLKLFLEQKYGAPAYLSQLIEANVAIEAHIWGAVSGLLLASIYLCVADKNEGVH